MVVHTCKPYSVEVEAEKREVRHPWLSTKFGASLGYMRPCIQATDRRQLWGSDSSSARLCVDNRKWCLNQILHHLSLLSFSSPILP